MKIEVWLKETNRPITYADVASTYLKGALYCVYQAHQQRVTKWPLANIWRIIEEYPDEDRRDK